MTIENVGIICKRPFCWLSVFKVDGKSYAVGSVFFDKTTTRKSEWYDKYYLALYELTNVYFSDDVKKRLTDIDIADIKRPLAEHFFPFYETFSKEALETKPNGWQTPSAKKIYEKEENLLISTHLFSKVFTKSYQKPLYDMLFE